MKKTYLVTGAAGFIGSKIAKQLIKLGNSVVTIDNLSTGYESNIPEGVIFIKGDCQDFATINALYNYKFEAIFHIAGQSSGEISFEDPVYDLQTNCQSVLMLLNYCRNSECNKFIFASTMSVYGDIVDLPVDETMLTIPKSFYGVGKLASEQYLKIFSKNFGISTASLRLFNVYGPGQNMKNLKQGMISIYIAQALDNRIINVKGALDRFRDFVYIDDVVDSFMQTYKNLKPSDSLVLNICSSVKTTVSEVLDIIQDKVGEEIKINIEESTIGDQFGIYGSNASASELINWNPSVKLDEGICRMINWCKVSL